MEVDKDFLAAILATIVRDNHGSSISIPVDSVKFNDESLEMYMDPAGELLVIEVKEE